MFLAAEVFERLCLKIFGFLWEDFGFTDIYRDRTNFGSYITYKNATTAIKISLEPREGGIFVELYRLIKGKLPRHPIKIHSDTVINGFDLNDLIALRSSPTLVVKQEIEKISRPDYLEKVLLEYANALRKYAVDILNGDFGVFLELEKIVKKRALELKNDRNFD